MARKIVVTSGKGGVGKTTVCANLGLALSELNLKVLLIDVDFGLNNLDVVMGMENQIVYDLVDVLEGKCRVKQALLQDFYNPNLFVFPSNHTYSSVSIDGKKINEILGEVEDFFDYILVDCPAGIENGFFRALEIADEAIVVTTPHISAIRDADKIINFLRTFNFDTVGCIINRARGDLMLDGDMVDIDTIEKYLKINLYGVVPENDIISQQLLIGGTVKNGEIRQAFKLIAKRINDGETEIFDCTKKYKGFIGNIKKTLRRSV